jgi:hypothetical protein
MLLEPNTPPRPVLLVPRKALPEFEIAAVAAEQYVAQICRRTF